MTNSAREDKPSTANPPLIITRTNDKWKDAQWNETLPISHWLPRYSVDDIAWSIIRVQFCSAFMVRLYDKRRDLFLHIAHHIHKFVQNVHLAKSLHIMAACTKNTYLASWYSWYEQKRWISSSMTESSHNVKRRFSSGRYNIYQHLYWEVEFRHKIEQAEACAFKVH